MAATRQSQAWAYMDSLLGRGKTPEDVISCAVSRYGDVHYTELQQLLASAVQSRVAGVAANLLGDDDILQDEDIPVVPNMEHPYTYRVLVVHNPGAQVWLDIDSLVKLGIKAIRAVVEFVLGVVGQGPDSVRGFRTPGGSVTAYPAKPLDNVPKGFLDITIRQIMRRG